MKWGFAGLGAILVGILTFVAIFLFVDATVINEEDYYSLKEAMAGAMYDSIDIDYYQKTGELKIIAEKFTENFSRRFTEVSGFGGEGYSLEFYDIIESPPKASVRIYGKTGEYNLTLDSDELSGYDIINELDGILLYNAKHLYTYERYAVTADSLITGTSKKIHGIYTQNILLPEEIQDKTCTIVSMEYVSSITQDEDGVSAVKSFLNNAKYWYKEGSALYRNATETLPNNNMTEKTIKASDICKIETMDYFEYKTQCKSSNPKPCLEDIEVTIPSNDCKVAGIKYRITWECSG